MLSVVKRFGSLGGTNTADAVRRHFRAGAHTRVVLVTDEQASWRSGDALGAVPPHVPVYTWNLVDYQLGHGPSGLGTRHVFGGLTDRAFQLVPLLEAGRDARWEDLFG